MNKIIFILFTLILLFANISALCEEGQIDINSASLEELDKLTGIGPAKAQAIIDERPFETLDNLIDVIGIGEIILLNITKQGLACVEEEQSKELEKENIIDEEEIEKEEKLEITESNIQEDIKINSKEVETIKLIPKDIKSGIDKEGWNKEKLATYGLVMFCILLISLFIIKIRKDKRNEFK